MDNSQDEFDLNTGVLLGQGSVFKGELSTAGRVIIAENAHVSGNISAKSMIVAGTFTEGDISVTGEFCLLSKAIVYCNLRAREISSESGAVFKGLFELL